MAERFRAGDGFEAYLQETAVYEDGVWRVEGDGYTLEAALSDEETQAGALRRAQVQSHVTARENGTFTVTLILRDDVDELMELQLMVADRQTADALAQRFQREPEKVYAQLTALLCGGENAGSL